AAMRARAVANILRPEDVLFVTAVGKIQAYHIHAGLQHGIQHLGVIGSRTQGCNNLGSSLHTTSEREAAPSGAARLMPDYFLARSSSIATAGRVLPSRNSRKAPPAVEI